MDDRLDWSRWLEAVGAPSEGLLHGPILNHASMLIDAAIDGQGIALARTMLAANDLITRRLVRPFRTAFSAQKHLLDRVPESDAGVAQDRRVSGLVAY